MFKRRHLVMPLQHKSYKVKRRSTLMPHLLGHHVDQKIMIAVL